VKKEMRHSPRNIIYHELTGLYAKVIDSATQTYIGLEGKVVNETYNTLVIQTEKGEKKILKHISKFMFTLPSGLKVIVDGSRIVGRPEERLKKIVSRKRW